VKVYNHTASFFGCRSAGQQPSTKNFGAVSTSSTHSKGSFSNDFFEQAMGGGQSVRSKLPATEASRLPSQPSSSFSSFPLQTATGTNNDMRTWPSSPSGIVNSAVMDNFCAKMFY
jgi:hypothetical protein